MTISVLAVRGVNVQSFVCFEKERGEGSRQAADIADDSCLCFILMG